MSDILKTGLLIGFSCVVWTFVMGFTGWYRHPVLLNLFWVVVVIEIALLVIGLRQTAARGRRYWGQVGAGTLMAAVAAVIIFLGSLLFTGMVFPGYFDELAQLQAEMLRDGGTPEEEIQARIEVSTASQSHLGNALAGAVGTLVTGLVASMVIGAFCRSRPETGEA